MSPTDTGASAGPFRTADLSQTKATRFALSPDASARTALAEELGVSSIRKLVFDGEIRPAGKNGFTLEGTLGATVVQPCAVTLAPVTTRIDSKVVRRFRPEERLESFEAGSEVEMPEDDTVEPLGASIDPAAVMAEALSLEIPDYPRAEDADEGDGDAETRPAGAEPIRDDDLKPFAGLAGLRDKLAGGGEDSGSGSA
ncbi:hypothetical protein ATO8_00485 [Roseivivax marinus]|uniref:50S ribosomal protein L34 n=1 Tax=Roseivivax marinus TaxID=1379903 RepID=W4HQQ8_9RHOB|nr:DUF177 domain-containing protein [Roseivivax marinus]ETW14340.1 hypothetical protein ATO8_00485 [Roseivivax marinus]